MQVTTLFFFLFFIPFQASYVACQTKLFFRDFLLHLNQRPLASERGLNNQLNNKTSYSHGCTGYVKRCHVPDYCFYCTVFLPANSAVSFRSSPFGRQVVNLIPPPPPHRPRRFVSAHISLRRPRSLSCWDRYREGTLLWTVFILVSITQPQLLPLSANMLS